MYYDFRGFCILRKPLRNLKNIQRKRVESVIYVNFFTFTFCYVVEKRLRPNILWEKCNLKTQITNTKTQTHEQCIHKFWFWSFFLTFLQNNFLWYFKVCEWSLNTWREKVMLVKKLTLRKESPYLELFWSAFSRIRSIYPYSVRIWENADQKNSKYRHFHAV